MGVTAGAQIYFSSETLRKRVPALNYVQVCNELISPGLLQTWMPVDFKSPKECKQQHLTISNVKAVHPTTDNINALHFLLNIDVYFPLGQITVLLPESSKEHQSQKFAPMHLVVRQLSKLRTFPSKDMFHFITKLWV